MSYLVGNPEARFSRVAAHIMYAMWLSEKIILKVSSTSDQFDIFLDNALKYTSMQTIVTILIKVKSRLIIQSFLERLDLIWLIFSEIYYLSKYFKVSCKLYELRHEKTSLQELRPSLTVKQVCTVTEES